MHEVIKGILFAFPSSLHKKETLSFSGLATCGQCVVHCSTVWSSVSPNKKFRACQEHEEQ